MIDINNSSGSQICFNHILPVSLTEVKLKFSAKGQKCPRTLS